MDAGPVVQSCFLPNTNVQFAWDSTSLGYLKRCPRLYQYIMIQGYQPKEDSIHLRYGIEYHTSIEEFHKARAAGATQKAAMRTAIRNLLVRVQDWDVDRDTPVGKYKNARTIVELVIDYLDKFRDDVAETYIKEDGAPAVELSFRFELDWGPTGSNSPYLLCGHLDQVVTFGDSLFVMDHKTSKNAIGDYYFDGFNPDNQMTLYALAGQIVINSPIKGVIIDAAQILLEKPHAFKRGMTLRTKEQLEEWTADLEYWLNQAEAYATANYWPMNDTSCGMYGGCRFREVCSKSGSTRHVYLKSNFHKLAKEERWNPLKPR